MRWTRVLKYVVVLFVATFLVGFVFGFVRGLVEAASGAPLSGDPLLAINLVMALAMFTTMTSVFGVMAYRTGRRVLAGVHLVGLAAWLTSFPLNVMLLGQTMGAWLVQGVFIEVCVLCGLGAGVGLRALVRLVSEPKDEPAVAPNLVPAEAVGTRG